MKTVKRIALFDNLKFVLILLVVVCHFIDLRVDNSDIYKSIFLFVYAFHMPLFIFISGLFFNDNKLKEKVIFFIVIGFLCKFVLFFSKLFFLDIVNFSLFIENNVPWFMFALAIYFALGKLLEKYNKKYILLFSIILACLIGYDNSVGDFLSLSRIIVFYPFFILGQMVNRKKLIELNSNTKIKVVSLLIVIAWALICMFCLKYVYDLRTLFTGRNPFSVDPLFLKWGCIYRLLCYAITICVSSAIIFVFPKRPLFFTKLGAKTLQVYFWHFAVIYLFVGLGLDKIVLIGPVGKLLWLLFGVVVTLILCLKPFGVLLNKTEEICKEHGLQKKEKKRKKKKNKKKKRKKSRKRIRWI